jgi:hypothetical protein
MLKSKETGTKELRKVFKPNETEPGITQRKLAIVNVHEIG